jgi:hypothetical protein
MELRSLFAQECLTITCLQRKSVVSTKGLNPSERLSLLSGHQAAIDGELQEVLDQKTYFNITLKPGATFWNLMSVFFL